MDGFHCRHKSGQRPVRQRRFDLRCPFGSRRASLFPALASQTAAHLTLTPLRGILDLPLPCPASAVRCCLGKNPRTAPTLDRPRSWDRRGRPVRRSASPQPKLRLPGDLAAWAGLSLCARAGTGKPANAVTAPIARELATASRRTRTSSAKSGLAAGVWRRSQSGLLR